MVPWRGIWLKLICSYKNRHICQINDFLPFFYQNYNQTSLENVIFFAWRTLFQCYSSSRDQLENTGFNSKQKKQKNPISSSQHLMSFRKKVKNLWWPQFRCTQNPKFTDLCNSGDTIKIFRKWSFISVHALPNFQMSYLHGENCNWKEKVTKKSKRYVICCTTPRSPRVKE